MSDANSNHTIRWAKALSQQGINVGLWSLAAPALDSYEDSPRLTIGHAGISQKREGVLGKARYLTAFNSLKRFLKDFRPDIVHAHYASSYGLLGRLTGFHPYVISVWGTDVYKFPNTNFIFRNILVNNLRKADCVLSTSYAMASEAKKYTDKEILITPFGIETDNFINNGIRGRSATKPFVFGTIKSLEKVYGIEYLIKAFALFTVRNGKDNVLLYIVGGGSQEEYLKKLAKSEGIDQICVFVGKIPYSQVPEYHSKFDVAVFLSEYESFGVSAIEASATGIPVIVSDVGGLPEVVVDGQTGIIVPAKDAESAADAMEKLFKDAALRENMGIQGRARVGHLYNWKDNVNRMIQIYNKIVKV